LLNSFSFVAPPSMEKKARGVDPLQGFVVEAFAA
jgi:hypothetical protein